MKPKYPVYIISKGRFNCCLTANFLLKDGVDFHIVVEPQEAEEYIKRYGTEKIYILPFRNLGLGSIPARNWCWEHSIKIGAKRHWIIDDNIMKMRRNYKGKRIACNGNIALGITEEFVDRYENIAVAGLNYTFFVVDKLKAFTLNCHVYSCMLILNSIPNRWRGRYNEDTDLCLQVLADKWCTVLMNAFTIDKMPTMTMKGGNSAELYKGDGRLKMARALERQWYGVVETKRRYQRPQHFIKNNWRLFDNPLIKRKDLDWEKIKNQTFDIKLVEKQPIKSEELKRWVSNLSS